MRNSSQNGQVDNKNTKKGKQPGEPQYGDRPWQNPQYGRKNSRSTDKSCGFSATGDPKSNEDEDIGSGIEEENTIVKEQDEENDNENRIEHISKRNISK